MKNPPGVLNFDSPRDACALSSFNPSTMFLYTNIHPVLLEEIIIIIVIMGAQPVISHDSRSGTFAEHMSQHQIIVLEEVSFFAGAAINRFVHVQCSLARFRYDKKHTENWETMKMEISDALFSASSIIETEKYFPRKRLLYLLLLSALPLIATRSMTRLCFKAQCLSVFFGRFHFYCCMLARRAKIAVRGISIMLCMYDANRRKRIIKRGFSPLVVCFFSTIIV
jgi:hypothetical protein